MQDRGERGRETKEREKESEIEKESPLPKKLKKCHENKWQQAPMNHAVSDPLAALEGKRDSKRESEWNRRE